MKKQGNILIEVVAASMILTLTTTFIVSASIQNSNILKERILKQEVSLTVSNLINEFKYNITKEEIEQMLLEGNEKIGLKYDESLSKKLINTDIGNLEQGNDIEVTKIDEDDMGLNLKITAKVNDNKNEVIVEKEFTKSWWMDEA